MSIADLRKEYMQASLSEFEVDADPICQFGKWFEEALKAKVPEANAMSVATASATGRPSSRILLIKEFDARGFVWFTNYASRKGEELAANPYAALLFFWPELERQVRIEGRVERVSEQESQAYFDSRPLASRLGAIASDQSRPIDSRATLESRLAQVSEQFGEHPAKPPHWGGYRLAPDAMEFWQGRHSRFHDRILYTRTDAGDWQIQRLQP